MKVSNEKTTQLFFRTREKENDLRLCKCKKAVLMNNNKTNEKEILPLSQLE